MRDPHALIELWFADALTSPEAARRREKCWFGRSAELDAALSRRFAGLPEAAAGGRLAHWRGAPETALALVVALDQLPRNLYRGTRRAYAFDVHAQSEAERAIDAGFDRELHPLMSAFLYMPFQHAEDPALQEYGVALFEALRERSRGSFARRIDGFLASARQHREIIRRFGRFPHRNAVLGRDPTEAEQAWLRAGGKTFGVAQRDA